MMGDAWLHEETKSVEVDLFIGRVNYTQRIANSHKLYDSAHIIMTVKKVNEYITSVDIL